MRSQMRNGFSLLIRDLLYIGLIDEKTVGQKSHNTIPLNYHIDYFRHDSREINIILLQLISKVLNPATSIHAGATLRCTVHCTVCTVL
jgi:hypothetical protein